jgi:hypothetical protein
MIGRRRVFAATVVALLVACTGDGTSPVAGTLRVNLTTPNSGSDGAIMLVLSAPVAPTSVTPGAGLALWGGPVTTTSARVVLTGTLSTGPILTLQVDDVNKVGQYSATVQQVAATAAGSFVRRSLTGYSASVTK